MIRFALCLSLLACGAQPSIEATDSESAIAAVPGPVTPPIAINFWTNQFPLNPNNTPASYFTTDVVVVKGCVYTAVVHQVTFQNWVGIMVSALSPGSCAMVTTLGGNGYVNVNIYNGPTAYARLTNYGSRLVFASSGSGGPTGSGSITLSTLSVKVLNAVNAAVTRSTLQSVCASGPGGQILPTTTLWVDASTGDFHVGGTKNAPTGLVGDGTCPMAPGAHTSYTLHYAALLFGSGPVPTPTITP